MAADYATVPITALNKPEPYHIEIPEEQLRDFKSILGLSRVVAPTYESLQEDGRFGVDHKWITETKKYWEHEFDWRKCEKNMNSFPNYMAKVKVGEEEFKVHFVALFSQKAGAIPIALFHGWPGSFLEFLPILSLMKEKYTPETLPYHLIVPSLPGYAFSSGPPLDRNFLRADIAKVMNQLMVDLGFGSGYVAQGGDIGSGVARILGLEFEACKAVLVNFAPLFDTPKGLSESSLTEEGKLRVKRSQAFMQTGSAYAREQGTRPSTIGLALGSSPLALLAWIGEKFLSWSDNTPSIDEILQSITLYWFTETMGKGIYTYREGYAANLPPPPPYLKKPFGYLNFPKEIIPSPRSWVETLGNLVFYRDHDKGGHFAALEQPELLMGDLEEFVEQVWNK